MKKTLYIFFLVPICILSMLTTIYIFSKDEPLFFIKNIRINGASQLGDEDIMGRISPFIRGNLFRIDIQKMKEIITSHPFVKEVRIKRVFPFSIIIDVKEKIPSALWVDKNGVISVLDECGEPYKRLTKGDIKNMFVINAGDKADVKSLYRETNSWITQGIIKRNAISEIAYDEGSVTVFGAEDGVEIVLGKEDQKERLKRAVSILEDAKKRGLMIKCIDARFEKGGIIQERKG
ncbi:MAG: FtsQ-type POTRA domain-containing protein [Proteobacteria bacterium]|nr:FtsQ-type POTRA domain-containing protein [Pseudomonadota bacterium]